MVFFFQRAIVVVKLLLLITIGVTAKLTYDLTKTSYDSEANNKYTHEQKINEKISHQKSSPLGNFEIAKQLNIPDHKKAEARDHSYFDKRHLFVESFTTTPSSFAHNAFSDVRFVATSFSPIKISVLKSIRTKSHENTVRVSGNNTSNGTTNDDLNYLNDTVLFAFDSYELNQAALLILQGQIEHLRENKNLLVTVEGHADELGTREYNLGLGERRANRVKDHFLTAGINAARIKTISYGKERPLIEGSTDYARSKNRRAVIIFSLPNTVKAVTLPTENTASTNAKDAISKQTTLAPISNNRTKTKKQNYTSDIDSPATRTQKRFIPFLRAGYLHSLNADAKKWFDECDTTCSDQWVSAGSSTMSSYNGQSIQLGLLSHSYYLSLGLEKQNNQTHIIRDITDRSGGRTWVLESDFNTSITFLELGKEWPIKNTKGLVTTFITGGEARRRLTRIYGNDAAGPWEGYTNIKSSQKMWRVGSGYAYTINNNWRIDGRLQYSNYGRVVLSNEDGGAATGRYIKAVEANIGLTYLFDQ